MELELHGLTLLSLLRSLFRDLNLVVTGDLGSSSTNRLEELSVGLGMSMTSILSARVLLVPAAAPIPFGEGEEQGTSSREAALLELT